MSLFDKMSCPKCGEDCDRVEVDVGVGWEFGPWGCPSCRWSEDSQYDCSEGTKRDKQSGCIVDQYGMLYPMTSDGSGTGYGDDDWDTLDP